MIPATSILAAGHPVGGGSVHSYAVAAKRDDSHAVDRRGVERDGEVGQFMGAVGGGHGGRIAHRQHQKLGRWHLVNAINLNVKEGHCWAGVDEHNGGLRPRSFGAERKLRASNDGKQHHSATVHGIDNATPTTIRQEAWKLTIKGVTS